MVTERAVRLRSLWREPFTGFLAAGALLFYLYEPPDEVLTEPILVDASVVAMLEQQHRLLTGKEVTESEREALIQRFIDEEVMVRAAYARGLDHGDGRVRQRLISKMDFLIDEEPAEPGPEDLKAIYLAAPSKYRYPDRLDVMQVVARQPGLSIEQRQELESGQRKPASLGSVGYAYGIIETELSQIIGHDAAAGMMAALPGSWHGPFSGPAGDLFLKVLASQPASRFGEEELERYLREDWYIIQREKLRRRKLDQLRRAYKIEIEHASAPVRVAGM